MESDNWIVQNLNNALETWNSKLAEIWQLLTQSPETFKDGAIWDVILTIHDALIGIGYGWCCSLQLEWSRPVPAMRI